MVENEHLRDSDVVARPQLIAKAPLAIPVSDPPVDILANDGYSSWIVALCLWISFYLAGLVITIIWAVRARHKRFPPAMRLPINNCSSTPLAQPRIPISRKHVQNGGNMLTPVPEELLPTSLDNNFAVETSQNRLNELAETLV